MSMTREEAIKLLKQYQGYEPMEYGQVLKHSFDLTDETVDTLLSALTQPTQEQMERVFGGEWEEERFAGELEGWMHIACGRHSTEKTPFCPKCGKAMTQEALEIIKKRWEALNDGKGD